MTAQLLPFPLHRRVDFVRRQAGFVATRRPGQDNKYLANQLRKQAETMAGRGFSEAVIEREIAALRGAINAAAWRLVMSGGEDVA